MKKAGSATRAQAGALKNAVCPGGSHGKKGGIF